MRNVKLKGPELAGKIGTLLESHKHLKEMTVGAPNNNAVAYVNMIRQQ